MIFEPGASRPWQIKSMVRSQAPAFFRHFSSLRRSAAALISLTVGAHCISVLAQQPKQPSPRIITVIMADGRSGKTMNPDNFVVRFNHLNAIRNETLTVNDDGTGKVRVPANATYISVQGTYHKSIDLYVNCDAAMDKDTSVLHWYAIDDILSTGVTAPNECSNGKYARSAAIPAAPGELIFYVREIGWRDAHME